MSRLPQLLAELELLAANLNLTDEDLDRLSRSGPPDSPYDIDGLGTLRLNLDHASGIEHFRELAALAGLTLNRMPGA